MIIKGIIDEDFVNYKEPSMYIAFPKCKHFKCDLENKQRLCQNSKIAIYPDIEISASLLVDRYLVNPITSAVVCAGLEPLDSFEELLDFVVELRKVSNDPVVVYTGYEEDEIQDKLSILKQYPKILVKFGRFRPNQKPHFDDILGVNLASDNQYAKKIS